MRRDEGPRSLEALAVEPERQAAVLLLLEQLVRAPVPDLHSPGAVLALRDLALECSVLERMVFDVDREVLLAGLERHAFGHSPAGQCAVALEAQVVVERSRLVALDDEDRRPVPFLATSRCLTQGLTLGLTPGHGRFGLRRLSRGPFATIVTKTVRRGHRNRLSNRKTASSCAFEGLDGSGISLWRLWIAALCARTAQSFAKLAHAWIPIRRNFALRSRRRTSGGVPSTSESASSSDSPSRRAASS